MPGDSRHYKQSKFGSRREFLGRSVMTAGGLIAGHRVFGEPAQPLYVDPRAPVPRVAVVRSDFVVDGRKVHKGILAEMLDAGILALTGGTSVANGWRTLLHKTDLIGIKFNRSGQVALGTSEVLAMTIIESLVAAGWSTEDIVLIELPSDSDALRMTRAAARGFGSERISFGSGSDQFSTVLDQVTAIIDVPFVKTHNIARMTCCLKNLSHGFVKHPGKYHGNNGCSPFITDIASTDKIWRKLRLCIADGLRVVYRGGPEPSDNSVFDYGCLLLSKDPVATDSTALSVLNEVRTAQGMRPLCRSAVDIPFLALAHRRGLGIAVPHGIETVTRTVS